MITVEYEYECHVKELESVIKKDRIVKEFDLVPFDKRSDVYTTSIWTDDWLWPVPTYNKGETWTFYGALIDCFYEVVDKNNDQILFKKVHTYKGREDGAWVIFNTDYHGYASLDAASMRIRIE